MPSLLDIANGVKTVPIRGQQIEVTGISVEGIVHLFDTFPDLRKLFDNIKRAELTAAHLQKLAPPALAAAIAAGTGHPGDKAHEAAARKLSVGEQSELLVAIFAQTFPQGVGPFVDQFEQLGLSVASVFGRAQGTISPAPPKS